MTEHPIYAGDSSVHWTERACAAPADEFGLCEEAARSLGVNPASSWTKPCNWHGVGWLCGAHHRVVLATRDPGRRGVRR